jgi:hypothetical protein
MFASSSLREESGETLVSRFCGGPILQTTVGLENGVSDDGFRSDMSRHSRSARVRGYRVPLQISKSIQQLDDNKKARETDSKRYQSGHQPDRHEQR